MEKTNPGKKNPYQILLLVFAVVNIVLFLLRARLEAAGLNTTVLIGGNSFLFLIFLVSTWMHASAAQNTSTQVFLHSMYGGMLLKLFGIAIAAFVYIYVARDQVNKPALFGIMFLYLLYTFIELRVVLKQTRQS